jgi:hypothetical protein
MLDKANAEGEFVFVRRSALQVKTGVARTGDDVDGTTDRIALPTGAKLIELSSTADCYIRFGTVAVDATTTIGDDDTASKLFMAGVQIIEVPSPGGVLATHIAYLQVAAAGFIQAEKLV